MRTTILLFMVALNSPGYCQVPDSLIKANQKLLDSIDFLITYPYRTKLSHDDTLLLLRLSGFKSLVFQEDRAYLDSLNVVFRDPRTPDILAQRIADCIGSIDSRWAMCWLVNNLFVYKNYYGEMHGIPLGPAQQSCSPALNAISKTNRYFEAYDVVMNSDFLLVNYEKLNDKKIFSHSGVLEILFSYHRFSGSMIEEYYYRFKEKSPEKADILKQFMGN